ncbi:MAG: DEAD/DEAH box helicase [Candidatus Paceibacterota bacterium]|jgi:ATP-dependent RNA helicase RhlE
MNQDTQKVQGQKPANQKFNSDSIRTPQAETSQQPPRQETAKAAFNDLGLSTTFTGALSKLNIASPTPIQAQAIPVVLTGKDVIGIAQTGTGKTLAFGLPMLQRLAATKGTGLVLVPTRELAAQVDEKIVAIGKNLGIRTALLVGGANMNKQVYALRDKPHVIIATPGRINDHIHQKTINLSNVSILVLDEADRMLDMGFEPQIRSVIALTPKTRQTLLFSATMPVKIQGMAHNYMKDPIRVEVAPSGTTVAKISEEIYFVAKEEKSRLLEKLLADHTGTVLVFSRTKHGAKRLAKHIQDMGHTATDIHSNKSLSQRTAALAGFKKGTYRILVATDIAARGIDVSNIELVINYDLPDAAEDYIHRIGRTGRADKEGKAITFAVHDERRGVQDIERLTKKRIAEKRKPEDLPPPRVSSIKERPYESQKFGGHRRGGSFGGSWGRRR